MQPITLIRAGARLSHLLFRHAAPLYLTLYDAYKRASDRDVIVLLERLIRPGDRAVDVGANVGFYARLMGRLVGTAGRVYAFEPDANNFRLLVRRVRRQPQVEIVRAAVTDRSGRSALFLSPDLNVDHRTYATDDARESVGVDAVSLDGFFGDPPPALRVVKLDIQGAEYAALRGMAGVLAHSPDVVLLMELWPFVHDRYGGGVETVLGFLMTQGFEVRRLGSAAHPFGERLTPESAIPERAHPDAYFDVVCARPGRLGL